MPDLRTPETLSNPGLGLFLADILDYAGIFPPACLPLHEAIENFARYRHAPEAWMLGRFVVPADQVSELGDHMGLFDADPPLRLSVLAGGGNDAATFLQALEADLELVSAFSEREGDRVAVEAFEMRLPADLLSTDVVKVGRFVASVADLLARLRLPRPGLFFEIPLDANCRQSATIAAGALHALNRDKRDDQGVAGLKMRTGGTQASAFPAAERVAEFIAAARDAGVPFKATAGLHHPVRRLNAELGTEMYGFFNVFAAAGLAADQCLDQSELLPVLLEEDASAFSFGKDGVGWRDRRLDLDAVARTRRDLALSFGSCSFAEPVDDLSALGLL